MDETYENSEFETWVPNQTTLDYIAKTHQKEAWQIDKVVETFRAYHQKKGNTGCIDWDKMLIGFCKLQKVWAEKEQPQHSVHKVFNLYGKQIIPQDEPFKTITNKLIDRVGFDCFKSWFEYCTWLVHGKSITITAPLKFTAKEIQSRHGASLLEYAKESGYQMVYYKSDYSLDFPYRNK